MSCLRFRWKRVAGRGYQGLQGWLWCAHTTKQHAAEKLAAWLRHEITQEQLVTWAEDVIREGDFPERERRAGGGCRRPACSLY